MSRRRKPRIYPLDESILRRLEKIFGPMSAAAAALKDAEARRTVGQEVLFAQVDNAIVVVNRAALEAVA